MKQKINLQLALIALIAVLSTAVGITLVCYNLMCQQVRRDLRTSAELLSASDVFAGSGRLERLPGGSLRITWVAADGSVLYDNDAQAQALSNHLDRPEIRQALETGSGEIVRNSDTLNMKNFYYALLLEDGSVLRVATQVRSIVGIFLTAMPVIVLISGAILLVCILLGHLLTAQLLRPIDLMAEHLDDVTRFAAYRELTPFADKIRSQHEKILAAAKSRQDFTANVSHELKTPLTAISGYAELIENKMVDPEQQVRFARQIRSNAARLLNMINDILRLSELDDAGQLAAPQPVELLALAQEVCAGLQLQARQREVRLQCFGRPVTVSGDRELLKELLENLIQNAVRYNREGGFVQVTVKDTDRRAVLTVEDNGIGIPQDQQERVFERFYRVDKSRSRETGGTGLGLAIVRHIVQLHNARIQLTSAPDKGTKITVEF